MTAYAPRTSVWRFLTTPQRIWNTSKSMSFALVLAVVALVFTIAALPHLKNDRTAAAIAIPPVRPVEQAPPPIEPLRFIDVSPQDAQLINAAVPFAKGPLNPARPFSLAGSDTDRESALTCLAAAQWYEAGDDPVGQAAVAQVVLNRVRHPAFPSTVCGVVFQGAERRTGCQFTFTCDGALARTPSEAAWKRARTIAQRALTGYVQKNVGLSTHYHTDWVVPYWSPTLDKVAKVGTHLFFRWKGGWGQPRAFLRRYAGAEKIDARIVKYADASLREKLDAVEPPVILEEEPVAVPVLASIDVKGVTKSDLHGSVVRLADVDAGSFVLQLDPATFAGAHAVTAVTLCRGRPVCTVVGYLQAERLPAALPVPIEAIRSSSFYYHRVREGSTETVRWNCRQMVRPDPAQCFPGTEPAGDAPPPVQQ